MASSDVVPKHALGSHAFEHFEAASYCSLPAAREAGQPQIAATCEAIMKQAARHGNVGLGLAPMLTSKSEPYGSCSLCEALTMRVFKTGGDWPADGLTAAAEYLIVKSHIFACNSLTAAERDALLVALEIGELQASWHGDGITWKLARQGPAT